jgi:transposase
VIKKNTYLVNSRDRQRLKVAAIHEKVSNARLDLLHKVSSQITNEYDTICLEDLNVKAMVTKQKTCKTYWRCRLGDIHQVA